MSSRTTSRHSRGEHSTHTIDLTKETSHPNSHTSPSNRNCTPVPNHCYSSSSKRHCRSHPTFNHAYHRVVSRQEREYDRANPNLIRERIDVAEERQEHPSKQRALAHITRAYVAVGYTHATFTIIICVVCASLLLAISYSVASDVARKQRDKASELIATAADCSSLVHKNRCIVNGNHVSHPDSYELTALCKKWVACANRGKYAQSDARSAKVWAETLADIINTFTERLSSTTIVIIAVLFIITSIFFSSSTFSFLHRRISDDSIMAQPDHPHMHTTPLIAHSPMRSHNQYPPSHRKQQNTKYLDYKGDTKSSSTSSRR